VQMDEHLFKSHPPEYHNIRVFWHIYHTMLC